MRRNSILCLCALVVASCATVDIKPQNSCGIDVIEALRAKAWKADRNGDNTLSKLCFTELCNCSDIEGCVNAVRFYDELSTESQEITEKACAIGDGTSCFLLAEKLSGDAAKRYYEKGCTLTNNFHTSAMSCRMAGILNEGEKHLYYLEKGCELGDEVACIEVWPMVKDDPVIKEKYRKIGCELGIPEICQNIDR